MSSSQSAPPAVEENVATERVRQPRFTGPVTNELHRLASYSPSDLPHLLYRVTSKESMGSSTEVGFQSALCKRRGQDQDLDFKKQDYQAMVGWFLNHKDNLKKGISPSPFISFSASLVTTLQRAEWLRKQNYKEIRVAVLETRRLNMGQLVIPMVEFLKAFNTSEERPYIAEDSMDEFLGWYRLDVETPVAEHITLVRNGLYKLAPELQQCADRVGGDLARLRSRLFGRSSSFVGRQFEFAMNLGDALYPGSIDTKIAFLCLRSHEKHRDELKNNTLAFLDITIRHRYFDPHGLVNYSFARYYRWFDNVASGAINAESKLYNPVHRQLMQEARKMEATIAAESTDRVKESLNICLDELVQARDLLAESLRDMTYSSLFHTLHGISSDVDAFRSFNEYVQECTARKMFEEYVVRKAGQSLTEMKRLIQICHTLSWERR